MKDIMSVGQNSSEIRIKEEICETQKVLTAHDVTVISENQQSKVESSENLTDINFTPLSLSKDKPPDSGTTTPTTVARKRKRTREHTNKIKALRSGIEKQISDFYHYSSSSDNGDEHGIIVSNLPNNWSFIEIKNYMDKVCGPCNEMEKLKNDDTDSNGSIRLSFRNEDECKKAMEKLANKVIDGAKIITEIDAIKDEPEAEMVPNMTVELGNKKPWRPDLDIWEIDPKGLYGLKPQYLNSLDIEPPIDKWVHVTNFRCDKSELRDVMELAGHVLLCSVFTVANRYAKVMYSHPLEAVQAVSMLDCQTFYGKPLAVTMDKTPADTVMLPKGLANIGLGLGKIGRPLRNIVKHYERFLNNQSSLVNTVIFDVNAKNVNSGLHNSDTKQEVETVTKESLTDSDNLGEFLIKNVEDLKTLVDEINEAEDNKNNEVQQSNLKTDGQNGKTSIVTRQNQNVQSITMQTNIHKTVQGSNSPQFSPNGPLVSGAPNIVNSVVRPGIYVQNQPSPRPPGCFRQGLAQFGPISSGVRPQGVEPFSRGQISPVASRLRGPRPFGGAGPRSQAPMPLKSASPVGPRPMVSPGLPIPGSTGPRMNSAESVIVQMSNLPPSTTFPFLCEKLSHCGQVLSLQLTTPGCAVVTFSRPIHAEICYKKYNGMNVEGCVINVTLLSN